MKGIKSFACLALLVLALDANGNDVEPKPIISDDLRDVLQDTAAIHHPKGIVPNLKNRVCIISHT